MFIFQQEAFKGSAKQVEVTQEQYNAYKAKITEAATQFNTAHTILKNVETEQNTTSPDLRKISLEGLETMVSGFSAALKGFEEAQKLPGFAAAPTSHPDWLETNIKNSRNYLITILPERAERYLEEGLKNSNNEKYEQALGDYTAAAKYCEQLLKFGDSSAITSYNLAQAYFGQGNQILSLGNKEESSKYYANALVFYKKAKENNKELEEPVRIKLEGELKYCGDKVAGIL